MIIVTPSIAREGLFIFIFTSLILIIYEHELNVSIIPGEILPCCIEIIKVLAYDDILQM